MVGKAHSLFLCFDWIANGRTSSRPMTWAAWINYDDVRYLCFGWLADGIKSSWPTTKAA